MSQALERPAAAQPHSGSDSAEGRRVKLRVGQHFHVADDLDGIVLGVHGREVKLGICSAERTIGGNGVHADGSGYFVTDRENGTMLVVRREVGNEVKVNGTARLRVLRVGAGCVELAAEWIQSTNSNASSPSAMKPR